MDDADYAQRQVELLLGRQIDSIRNTQRRVYPEGRCHFCHEPFEPDDLRLFCNPECATDYERL